MNFYTKMYIVYKAKLYVQIKNVMYLIRRKDQKNENKSTDKNVRINKKI